VVEFDTDGRYQRDFYLGDPAVITAKIAAVAAQGRPATPTTSGAPGEIRLLG